MSTIDYRYEKWPKGVRKPNKVLRLMICLKFDNQRKFAKALTDSGLKRSETQISQVCCARRFITEEEANVWRILLECDEDVLQPCIRPQDTLGCLGRKKPRHKFVQV